MGDGWNPFGFQFLSFVVFVLLLETRGCCSLSSEGLVLLKFRARIHDDPYNTFSNWDANDGIPCMWTGVHCVDGKVQILDLPELSLEGILAPELGKLSHLRSIVLYGNRFSGVIPKEIGELKMLVLLDLRFNNLSGRIPAELGKILSLKRLLICANKFEGSIPLEIQTRKSLYELQVDENLTSDMGSGLGCRNRKFGHCIWQNSLNQLTKAKFFIIPNRGTDLSYFSSLHLFKFKFRMASSYGNNHNGVNNLQSPDPRAFVRRRLLEESKNLPAAPASSELHPQQINTLPITRSSGTFPAVLNKKKNQSHSPAPLPSSDTLLQPPSNMSTSNNSSQTQTTDQTSEGNSSKNTWKYVLLVPATAFLLIIFAAMLCMCRSRGVKTIGPWKTGLSGQLQKAFITGVPKLNRSELETACEDFSNIIDTLSDCTVYKGTLSSGVEIAVASSAISSSKDWSKRSERAYRKKIDTLSRVNHKNFVNLIGYCEEDEPFNRMMVFEYAPNGSLFEHLHVKEVEHLDWNARMRIIMGTAYCLQYMHHDLNPPVPHSNLNSHAIYLTDDYAAKIAEISFLTDVAVKSKTTGEDESEHSELPPLADTETNVYSFGILLLEIISGKLPYSEEQGSLLNWAADYLNDKRSISYMIDPTLKSFKNNELDIVCEVIQDCIHPDPRHRPTMKEVTSKLREVIAISSDAATPRLSPLWWAELEILSVEAS